MLEAPRDNIAFRNTVRSQFIRQSKSAECDHHYALSVAISTENSRMMNEAYFFSLTEKTKRFSQKVLSNEGAFVIRPSESGSRGGTQFFFFFPSCSGAFIPFSRSFSPSSSCFCRVRTNIKFLFTLFSPIEMNT